jgi:hypothetical protein
VSIDNPYSEAQFKTLKYRPGFPRRFDSIQAARAHCQEFFPRYNDDDHHGGLGLHTAADVHYGQAAAVQAGRAQTLTAYHAHPERFVRKPPAQQNCQAPPGPGLGRLCDRRHLQPGLVGDVLLRRLADRAGGAYASRLRLVELPACALTTPQESAYRVQTPLDSANDVRASQLGADVTLPAVPNNSGLQATATASPAAAAGADAVLGATTSASGSGGDYTATPLSEAGTWAEAGSSGAFTYSYPIQVPPSASGTLPPPSAKVI